MTQIKNKYVKRESIRIGKKSSLIKSKPQLSLIKLTIVSRISSITVTSKTDDSNYWAHGGGSDVAMGGLIVQLYAGGDHDGGGDSRGRRRIHTRSRSCCVFVNRAGFHVTEP